VSRRSVGPRLGCAKYNMADISRDVRRAGPWGGGGSKSIQERPGAGTPTGKVGSNPGAPGARRGRPSGGQDNAGWKILTDAGHGGPGLGHSPKWLPSAKTPRRRQTGAKWSSTTGNHPDPQPFAAQEARPTQAAKGLSRAGEPPENRRRKRRLATVVQAGFLVLSGNCKACEEDLKTCGALPRAMEGSHPHHSLRSSH